jgi:hypothetical protein
MNEENEGDLYTGYNEFNPLLDTEVLSYLNYKRFYCNLFKSL